VDSVSPPIANPPATGPAEAQDATAAARSATKAEPDSATEPDEVQQTYLTHQQRLGDQGKSLDQRDRRLSTVRGVTFLVAAASGLYALFRPSLALGVAVAVAWTIFIVFVVLHAMVSTRQFEIERRLELCRRALARLAGSYRAPAKEAHRRGDGYVDPDHPYASDLDVFGPASLFEQLNTTQTPGGAAVLARWLGEPTGPEAILARQRAVQELAPLGELREEMALAGMRASEGERDAGPFLEWAGGGSELHGKRGWLVALSLVLVAVTMTLLALSWVVEASWTQGWLAGCALQIVLLIALRPRLEPILAPVCVKQSPLGTYHGLMALIEQQSFADQRLGELQSDLREAGDAAASAQMMRLDKLVGLAAVRHNALVHIVADVFLLWDVWCAWLLDRWRAEQGARVASWLATLSEMEALASLATYAHEHPSHAWPQVDESSPQLRARDLGHPLIPADQRVTNDATLDGDTPALMVTGSNMSGKSTMLRSLGVNVVLAQAGAPVCAASLAMSPLRVCTSIRVDDALDQGASRFYMEVRRLKSVVDALGKPGPTVLFLLDEVLHGTNSRERNVGAKAVVRHLVARGAIGAVSSHDLGLVQLEELTDGRVKNVHFEDHLEDDAMCFDYRMKPGPVGTSNALRLMRQLGIDVDGLAESDGPDRAG